MPLHPNYSADAASAASQPTSQTAGAGPFAPAPADPDALPLALLLTDLVDSAATSARLGDADAGRLWAAHDRLARDLLRDWRGREIDKTDGFLILFTSAHDALGYVLAYHRALARLDPPLRARAGLHVGLVNTRATPLDDVARGAKPLEVDGINKPLAARVMSTALGGQTLLTAAARDALGATAQRVVSHGHWRVKGLPQPIELFEVGEDDAPFTPPPDGSKVYRVVRDGELWLPVRNVRHSLPAERDAFVGRRSALLDLARRFEEGARLVSVLGIGGSGKTRLATHYAWTWLGEFAGGVWFCDLAAARTEEGVMNAVAQGLDVPLSKGDPVAQIGHAIHGRGHCLVILDNFEQVARHAEATLGQWLARAPQALFLVTSREVLGISGETALALPPLPGAEAEALFMRRAHAARRDFNPQGEDSAAIAPLVRLLDGLPLAIELAAARVRMLSPTALLARMSERFKLLASSGGRLDRQATLRATFDWSWDLLSTPEKAALAQLAVFEGGFTLDAMEAVVDVTHCADAPWPLDLLHSLVDKSFVRALGHERFDLLVSVQAYAAEHLQTEGRWAGSGAAALEAARQRHGQWFAALGPEAALAQSCADLDNLVAACQHALNRQDSAVAVGALEGAWAALASQGPFAAGAALAQSVCALPGQQLTQQLRSQGVLGAALTALGQWPAARAALLQARAAAQECRDGVRAADLECRLGSLCIDEGDVAKAQTHFEAALQALEARQTEQAALRTLDAAGAAGAVSAALSAAHCAALSGLGSVAHNLGRTDQAVAHFEAAHALALQQGDRRWQANVLGNLANVLADQGRMEEALQRGEETLALARALGQRSLQGNTLCNLGMLHFVQGRLAPARQALDGALQLARELGHVRLESITLCNRALVFEAAQEPVAARQDFEAALALSQRLGDRRSEGQFLGYLGSAQARSGELDKALASLDAGQAILLELQDSLGLGVLLCHRAEALQRAGQSGQAQAAFEQAQNLAQQSGAGPESELGLKLDSLRALLAPLG